MAFGIIIWGIFVVVASLYIASPHLLAMRAMMLNDGTPRGEVIKMLGSPDRWMTESYLNERGIWSNIIGKDNRKKLELLTWNKDRSLLCKSPIAPIQIYFDDTKRLYYRKIEREHFSQMRYWLSVGTIAILTIGFCAIFFQQVARSPAPIKRRGTDRKPSPRPSTDSKLSA